MEELLKEILAELKQINSGIIMSADDMLALLERNKQITDDRTRSIYRESFEMYKAQKAEEKPEVKEQKEKAHPLEDRVIELEKTVEALKNNSIIIKPIKYGIRVEADNGQLFVLIHPIQPETELF